MKLVYLRINEIKMRSVRAETLSRTIAPLQFSELCHKKVMKKSGRKREEILMKHMKNGDFLSNKLFGTTAMKERQRDSPVGQACGRRILITGVQR